MEQFIIPAMAAAIQAGNAILEVYRTDFSVAHKSDDSPLTLADKRSHEIITAALLPLGLPILSEEGGHISFSERKAWDRFWLVDPLDGTKEFVKRNDEFTVNIALIQDQVPVMGIIYVPVWGVTYFAEKDLGAYKLEKKERIDQLGTTVPGTPPASLAEVTADSSRLPLSPPPTDPYIIVGSRSHATLELEAFVESKRKDHENVAFISAGSSLKLCQVAEGKAAIYPRLGPTMEWDTAAGQAIATGAGARVVRHDTGAPLVYNKEDLLNPWFIVEM